MKDNSIRTSAVSFLLFAFVVSLVMAGWVSTVSASDNEETGGESLADLPGIWVMALPTDPEAERNGLKREQIQADVETKLRNGGVKLLTARQMEKQGFPYLSVNVNVVKDKKPEVYSYDIKVELYKQEIMNPKDAEEHIGFALYDTVKIWSSELTGTATGGDLKNSVQKQIDAGVDKFINAYLAANPKK